MIDVVFIVGWGIGCGVFGFAAGTAYQHIKFSDKEYEKYKQARDKAELKNEIVREVLAILKQQGGDKL